MKRISLLAGLLLVPILGFAQTRTTVTGTVFDITGAIATSGSVQFTLQPTSSSLGYTVTGQGIIVPISASCAISGTGTLIGISGSGSCQLWGNTVISPASSCYAITLFPNGTQSGTLPAQQISGTTYDLSNPTACPTNPVIMTNSVLDVAPINGPLIPVGNKAFNLGGPTAYYSALYTDQAYINNLNVPLSSLTANQFQGTLVAPQGSATSASLSAELNTSPSNWTVGSNVVNQGGGSYAFTAVAGTITQTFAVTNAQRYLISFTLGTVPSDTCGHLTISLGAASSPTYLYSCSDTGIWARAADLRALTTGNVTLTFTPSSDFHGHISAISVKQILAVQPATWVQTDSFGNSMEGRSSSALVTTGLGLAALEYNSSNGGTADFGSLGANNTGFGNSALMLNSLGYNNTAMGSGALQDNTVGFANTASGYQALAQNTYGFRNTAYGYLTLNFNTTGQGNTAIGDEALFANQTGVWNVAVGSSACQDLVGVNGNTCIGVSALNLSVTGADNTAIGISAMQNETAGNLNLAVGTGALQGANFDGSLPMTNVINNTTAVGTNCLFYQENVDNNTGLGFYCGADFNSLSNNNRKIQGDTQMTLLGWSATKNTGSTLSNSTAIGYEAWVTKSNQFMFGNSSVAEWNLGAQYALTPDTSRLGATGLRLQAQGSANSASYLTTMPNGTTTESGVRFYNSSDPNNAGWMTLNAIGSVAGFSASSAGTGTAITQLQLTVLNLLLTSGSITVVPTTYTMLPTCNSSSEGLLWPIKDSTSATFNATISGSGSNHIIAYCNGSNYVVH